MTLFGAEDHDADGGPLDAPGQETAGRRGESIVPMINVVFLLLVFFLMTATLAPPEPFEVAPPSAAAGRPAAAPDGTPVLHLAADGRLAFGTARDAAVWPALAAHGGTAGGRLTLRADAGVEAVRVAALLDRLAGLGIAGVDIVALPPR